jgi:hypothetical protein
MILRVVLLSVNIEFFLFWLESGFDAIWIEVGKQISGRINPAMVTGGVFLKSDGFNVGS